eukprot:CAMPEP_0194729048 /NCGR_PEP_ID=MMETSP0296-20130528/44340_1 /TAXON_ID=39354 /ORGANISM="Heterosigma akashiwo, Strain CCMP2393" /LENGTH=30 /DNA_ID= /DNA_START= /DNA_END= /DNA_ORIENTATION=
MAISGGMPPTATTALPFARWEDTLQRAMAA